MRLEPTRFERLKAEIDGSKEYLEEIRGSRERKIREIEELQVTHNNTEANEKSYLEGQIEYLEQEEQRTVEKIENLEERISEEDEPVERDEPIEVSTYKAGKLGVTKDLASIGLSWKDISELCQDYDELLGAGVPPAIYDKENSKVPKRGDQIKIEGRRKDVELERQLERERIEESERLDQEVEEQVPKESEPVEHSVSREADSVADEQPESTQTEETPEDVEEIDTPEVQEISEEAPNVEESVCVEAEPTEMIDEIPEEFGNMEMEVFDE